MSKTSKAVVSTTPITKAAAKPKAAAKTASKGAVKPKAKSVAAKDLPLVTTSNAEGRLPTADELLDEALSETFPASDPISPASPPAGLTRDERVRHAAYHMAEARRFEGGDEVADWLAAEALIDAEDVRSGR